MVAVMIPMAVAVVTVMAILVVIRDGATMVVATVAAVMSIMVRCQHSGAVDQKPHVAGRNCRCREQDVNERGLRPGRLSGG